MIQIEEKKYCCGCNACVQICPRQCIVMQEDNEGFLYPHVDKKNCINCHLCEKVCPTLNQSKPREPLKVYAAINKNEKIRMGSSSGGIFTALAEKIIDEGGVVFGARFDNKWDVIHDYVENKEELERFRGSKYVQSRIEDNYKKAEYFLKTGRKVLFTGTPCQIAGLKLFLRKPYDNLLTVDFICHGVPSPSVWRQYLNEEISRLCDRRNLVWPQPTNERDIQVESISFRDKALGWKKFSFALKLSTTKENGEKYSFSFHTPLNKNLFLKGFLSNLFLRPSCHSCCVKQLKSGSNLTIGDFWNIALYDQSIDDNKGLSIIIINDSQGEKHFNLKDYKIRYFPNYNVNTNHALTKSTIRSPKRELFFQSKLPMLERLREFTKQSFKEYIRIFLKKTISKLR